MLRKLSPIVAAMAVFVACTPADRSAELAADDLDCFGSRVLSFQDVVAEVIIPPEESCSQGSFVIHFTRGMDTLISLTERRTGNVGFIGTSDIDGDGRGEFFVSTDTDLFVYADTKTGPIRLPLADLSQEQSSSRLEGGMDHFGFGAPDLLVRGVPSAAGDTTWYGYSFSGTQWAVIEKPTWIR